MNLFGVMQISSSALWAERARAEIVAANMANAETTRTGAGTPYQRQPVVFESAGQPSFGDLLRAHSGAHLAGSVEEGLNGAGSVAGGVQVAGIVSDTSAALTVNYKLAGAAKGGVDYKALSGSVTIPAGAAQAKIKIKPIDNAAHDGTRVVKIKLKPSIDGSYSLGTSATAKIKIIDND